MRGGIESFEQLSAAELTRIVCLEKVKDPEIVGFFEGVLQGGHSQAFEHCAETLLVYLQDMNWPVAPYAASVLRQMSDRVLIPALTSVFEKHSDDEVWMAWLCVELMEKRPESCFLNALKPSVMDFIQNCPHWEERIMSIPALIPVLEPEDFDRLCEQIISQFELTSLLKEELKSLRKLFQSTHSPL